MMEDHEDEGGRGGGNSKSPGLPRMAARRPPSSARPDSSSPYSPIFDPQRRTAFPPAYSSSGSNSDSEEDEESEEEEEEEEEEEITPSTFEAAVAAKESIERFYKNYFQALQDRENRYEPA